MPSIEEKAYAAGFFDGEGCISVIRNYNKKYSRWYHELRASVTQKHPEVLEWLCDIWGGSAYQGESLKSASNLKSFSGLTGKYYWYHWIRPTAKAAQFLTDILPYMKVKREQAILALEFAKLMHPPGKGRTRKCSNDELALREAYREAIVREHHKEPATLG